MTKVAFVVKKLGFSELISIPILSAILKQHGHDVKLFVWNESNCIESIKYFSPDIVGYSIMSCEASDYLSINRILKNNFSFFSIFGGPHPTFFPDFINEPYVDGICIGEGDIAFIQFIENLERKTYQNTSNMYFKDSNNNIIKNDLGPLVDNLDNFPFPDRDVLFAKSTMLAFNSVKSFLASRGCPYKCTYCFNHSFNKMYEGKGRILRHKSVKYLIEEINQVRSKYPMQMIKFYDDIFGWDANWLNDFAKEFPKGIGLPFGCFVRPNMVTEEYVKLLKEAGCYSVYTAIEAGNEIIRNSVLKRNMNNDMIFKAFDLFHKYNLKTASLNMLGLPDEQYEDMITTLKMNQKLNIDFAESSIFQPHPGTEIAKYCVDKGYIGADKLKNVKGIYSETILNYDQKMKVRINILHKLFPFMVDHPELNFIIPYLHFLRFLYLPLKSFYLFYWGYFLKKRIYPTKISLREKIKLGFSVIFSVDKT